MATSVEQVFSMRKTPGVPEVVVRVRSRADAATVWPLLATPGRWPRWAPHVARAVVDGAPADVHVQQGMRVRVHGHLPGVAVAAVVTLVEPGARWDFVADLPGPWSLSAAHAVRPAPGGSAIATRLRPTGPGAALLGRAALTTYAPLARFALTRLARLAERGPDRSG